MAPHGDDAADDNRYRPVNPLFLAGVAVLEVEQRVSIG